MNTNLEALETEVKKSAENYINLGAIQAIDEPLKAIESYTRAIQLWPEFQQLWQAIAKLHKRLGNDELTDKALSKSFSRCSRCGAIVTSKMTA